MLSLAATAARRRYVAMAFNRNALAASGQKKSASTQRKGWKLSWLRRKNAFRN
jgi:hypothetical protein